MKKLSLLTLIAMTLFASCTKNDTAINPPPPDAVHGIYILNEGNFQRGNSTLSYYVPDSGMVYNDIFRTVNGADLGDTGNSITIRNGRAYIVVNGSNKIEVIDVRTHKRVKTIQCPGGASPRFIIFAQNGTGYISNLYTNNVSIYNDETNSITGEIAVGDNPEQMLAANDFIFVTNSGFGNGNTISVINTTTNTVVKTLTVGDNPTAIAALNGTTAVALCTGAYNDFNDPNDDTPGKIYYINTLALEIVDSLELGGHPQRLALDDNSVAYTLQSNGVMKIDLATKIKTDGFIPGSFYSVAFDPARKQLYLTDPLDYLQPGKLEVYGMDGKRKTSHTVGIIPGMTVCAE